MAEIIRAKLEPELGACPPHGALEDSAGPALGLSVVRRICTQTSQEFFLLHDRRSQKPTTKHLPSLSPPYHSPLVHPACPHWPSTGLAGDPPSDPQSTPDHGL